ncbi:MAG: ROK family protein [Prevotellaceae bacterium]|jgi:glucokinase|nr:ROK family protein [Prevotellaceae bacterium]
MYNIAIDLGGTIVKIGLLHKGKVLNMVLLDSRRLLGLEANLNRIREEIDRLLSLQEIDAARLGGIGLAFPGLVDSVENRVISTNKKYDDACRIDLNQWVKQNWNVQFFMDNDARMAVVGEWRHGAAKGFDNVVMMTVGTGIGTGVIINGQILYGKHFQAGSLGGHIVLDYRGRKCSCGNVGCVESVASSFFLPSIIREHARLSASFKRKAEKENYDFKEIFHLAAAGNADALLLRNECMDVWAAAVVSYIHAYDPEIVVLGGGIMKSGDIIIPHIQQKIDRYAWCPSEKVILTAANLGDRAALAGIDYQLRKRERKKHGTKNI